MRRYSTLLAIAVCGLTVFLCLCLPSSAEKKSAYGIASFAKYVQIPGATPVGSDTCKTCHADVAANYRHAFHAQQGLDCEACHGPGSLHVQGGGDIAKIISFSHRSAADANGVCLSCHANDARVRNWITGPHASNKVRCIDCHQTHTYSAKAGSKTEAGLDVASRLELLTAREVCAILRCHEKTLYEWVKRGSLTAIRVGSKLKFDPADLATFKRDAPGPPMVNYASPQSR